MYSTSLFMTFCVAGDFAVLLRAGMSVKQAIVYNCVSSVLCFVGMLVGVAIGNIHNASLWVFAGVAGMFLYISMVDMVSHLLHVSRQYRKSCSCTHVWMTGLVMSLYLSLWLICYVMFVHICKISYGKSCFCITVWLIWYVMFCISSHVPPQINMVIHVPLHIFCG